MHLTWFDKHRTIGEVVHISWDFRDDQTSSRHVREASTKLSANFDTRIDIKRGEWFVEE
jgi:hypothetical protein